MKNKILLILFLSVLTSLSFAGNITKAELVKGKWMNKADGYYPTPIMPSEDDDVKTVSRFKTIMFFEDGTFSMDSAKHEYPGKYYIDGDEIKLVFEETTVIHYSKNIDPNATDGGYATTPETIRLDSRIAKVVGDKLIMDNGLEYEHRSASMHGLLKFWEFTGFANATKGHLIMLVVGLVFIFLGIRFNYEPLLLIPIGVGILIGNIPMFQAVDFNLKLGIYEPGSVFNIFYGGVVQGWFPPLIFLGIGAMTDFSSLISNPRLMLLGAAAQFGVFSTFLLAILVGFHPAEAGAIGIIGGADGPTAIFISSKLANGVNIIGFDAFGGPIYVKNLIGPIAIAAYSYMALVPVIQPPIVKLLTTKKERKIRMNPPRQVSKVEKIIFPIIALLLTAFISPTALPLLGMLFFGNIMKESGVTRRLADTASNAIIDTITILLGLTVGASTQADVFLTSDSVLIFIMGALSFIVATTAGVLAAKIMNWLSPKSNPVNPIIGIAGVSAVPDSARVAQELGHKEDNNNYLLMHAMAPNVSGVIGSAVAAGILLSFLL